MRGSRSSFRARPSMSMSRLGSTPGGRARISHLSRAFSVGRVGEYTGDAILGVTRAAAESRMSRKLEPHAGGIMEYMKERFADAQRESRQQAIIHDAYTKGVWQEKIRELEERFASEFRGRDQQPQSLRPRLSPVKFIAGKNGPGSEKLAGSSGILGASVLAEEARTSRLMSAERESVALDIQNIRDALINGPGPAKFPWSVIDHSAGTPSGGRKSEAGSSGSSMKHFTLKGLGLAPLKDDNHDADGAVQTKRVWRPRGCETRYATPYPMPPPKVEVARPKVVPPQEEEPEPAHAKPGWCALCMRDAFDPYVLPCGHSFCRRCVANSQRLLLQEHTQAVSDTRAVMRCPLKCCKAVIPCLPLVNGDFRFEKVRPGDKVKEKESNINPCDQYRLRTYKVWLDVDLITRKSDDLFDGYDDVKILP